MSNVLGSVLPYCAAAVAAVGIWVVGLRYLDVFTPSDVKAWRKLAGMRGYALPAGRVQKAMEKAPIVARVQAEFDIARLLGIAGIPETALSFLMKSLAMGAVAAGGCLAIIAIYWIFGVDPPFPPVTAILFGVIPVVLRNNKLRSRARAVQKNSDKALADILTLVAIMTDGRGLQLEDAVKILSRCLTTSDLEDIVDNRGWQRMVHEPYQTTLQLYRLIAEAFDIPMFARLSEAAANANVGFSERETYTRLAQAIFQGRLADARLSAARGKILVTIPVAGMLLPLLVLIGAPTFAAIAGGLG